MSDEHTKTIIEGIDLFSEQLQKIAHLRAENERLREALEAMVDGAYYTKEQSNVIYCRGCLLGAMSKGADFPHGHNCRVEKAEATLARAEEE
jgi:hypothetical protein